MPLHSKHVFLFPFRWDVNYEGKKKLINNTYDDKTKLSVFDGKLKDHSPWKEISKYETHTPEQYNTRTYFYPFVRRALFPAESDSSNNQSRLLRQYQYPVGEKATYQIIVRKVDDEKSEEEKRIVYKYDKTFNLDLKTITLTVYELGIGILSFSLENTEYHDPEDVLHINDYGRRLYPQFLGEKFALKNAQNNFLASQINLFNQTQTLNIRTDFSHNFSQEPDYLPPHILSLLNQNDTNTVKFAVNRLSSQINKQVVEKMYFIRIEPVLDDRMYVLCWYGNEIAKTLAQVDELGQSYPGIHSENNFWYRFIYVDNSDISSTDSVFIKDLIEQTTYTRWAGGYKTLYGVSRYSFVLLTAPPDKPEWLDFGKNILSVHLTTIYSQLVTLCLVQRAALLRFSGEVAYISRQLRGNDVTLALISEQVQQLNRSYLEFDNRVYFTEVSAQEQGIELYDLAQRMMRIPQLAHNVKNEIANLHEYLQTATGENERVAINRLSIIGGLFGLAGFFISYFGLTVLEFKKFQVNETNYVWFAFGIFLLLCFTAPLLVPSWLLKGWFAGLKRNSNRRWLLYLALATVSALVLIPMLISINKADRNPPVQPVIDSTIVRRLDSLRNEIRLLRSSQPKALTVTSPQALTNAPQ